MYLQNREWTINWWEICGYGNKENGLDRHSKEENIERKLNFITRQIVVENAGRVKNRERKSKMNSEIDAQTTRNSCYTYFKIVGDFNPEEATQRLNLVPTKQWHIGDIRKNGTKFDFALWEYGRCDVYDVIVENQMMKTIQELIPKISILNNIRNDFDVEFTLEIVPEIYAGETTPCLAPNKEVIKFCYETSTNIDIDLYVYDSITDV